MLQLHSLEELQTYIRQDGLAVLEIASITCAPCTSIKRKIEEWAVHHPEVHTAYLEIEEVPETSGELQIFTAPAVVVFADGRRCIEKAGYFSLDDVFAQIERYIELMG